MTRSEKDDRESSSSLTMSQKENEKTFKIRVVYLIKVAKSPEKALDELSAWYKVEKPRLQIGLPKGEKRALGCYVQREKTIHVADSEFLYDPYVITHEFYHHLRSLSGKHRGSERHAREFAESFVREGASRL